MSPLHDRPATERTAQRVRRPGLVRVAEQAVRIGNRVKARFHLRLAVELHPADAAAWQVLADVVDSAAERTECLTRAVALDPSLTSARAALADELTARRDFAAALRIDPTHLPALLGAAAAATTPAEVIGLYGRVLAIDPDHPVARERMLALIRPSAGHHCPFCHTPTAPEGERCQRCRAVLTVADPHAFHGPTRCDVEVVAAAAARLEQGADPSAARPLHLALAHLNLGNTATGVRRLKEVAARSDVPPATRERVSRLLDHLHGAKSTVRMTRPAPTSPFAPLVLVADDSPTVRAIAASALEAGGYRTVCVCDGTEVDSAIRLEGVPALAVLAVNMPCMGGYAVSKGLKQNPLTKDVPVLFLTTNDGLMGKLRTQWSGGADHLTKPLKPSALMVAVTKRVPLTTPRSPDDTTRVAVDSPTERIQVRPRG